MAVLRKADSISFFIVFPYLEHDLVGLLDAHTVPSFTIAQVKYYAIQLLQGISCMHQSGLLHRDVKSANVLVGNRGEVKLADFGLARSYDMNRQITMTPGVVTRWYRPPELLLGASKYTTAVDVWGVGCVIAELIIREPLFQGKSEIHQLTIIFDELGWPGPEMKSLLDLPEVSKLPALKEITDTNTPTAISSKSGTGILEKYIKDSSLLDLIRKLLEIDPQRRISAKEALEHPTFTTSSPPPATVSELPFFGNASFHELEKRKRDASRQSAPSSTSSLKAIRMEKNDLAPVESERVSSSSHRWEDPPKEPVYSYPPQSRPSSTERFHSVPDTHEHTKDRRHEHPDAYSENKDSTPRLGDGKDEIEKDPIENRKAREYTDWGDYHNHHRTSRPELRQHPPSFSYYPHEYSSGRRRYEANGRYHDWGHSRHRSYNTHPSGTYSHHHSPSRQHYSQSSRYHQRPPLSAMSRDRNERFRRPAGPPSRLLYRNDSLESSEL